MDRWENGTKSFRHHPQAFACAALLLCLCMTAASLAHAEPDYAKDLPTVVPLELAKQCRFTQHEKELVENCLQIYKDNDCDNYPPDVQFARTTCSIEELNELNPKNGDVFIDACAADVKKTMGPTWELIKSLPSLVGARDGIISEPSPGEIWARQECMKKEEFKGKTPPAWDFSSHWLIGTSTAPWYRCVEAENLKYLFAKVDKASVGLVQRYMEMRKNLSCFKPTYWGPLACHYFAQGGPMGQGLLGFGSKVLARQALAAAVKRGLLDRFASKAAKKWAIDLKAFQDRASLRKEELTGRHIQDLGALAHTSYIQDVIKKLGIDFDSMMQGILDSDMGKYFSYWKELVLDEKSDLSERLLLMLTGNVHNPEGRLFAEVLKKAGMEGKTFFNKNLSPAQLRKIFSKNETLRNFMHEVPGMAKAIEDLNNKVINEEQFKARIAANLGHNGLGGYWKKYGDGAVTNSLESDDEKILFENSVLEGEKDAEGRVHPRYIGPPTEAGVVHYFMDRMSQATRIGILKISAESADKGALNFDMVERLFAAHVDDTLDQLKALHQHLDTMKVGDTAKSALHEMITQGQKRIVRERVFLDTHVVKSGDELQLLIDNPDGSRTTRTIKRAEKFDAEGSQKKMDELLQQEERLNGDPMRDFPQREPRKGPFYLTRTEGDLVKTTLTTGLCPTRVTNGGAGSTSAPSGK